MFDKIFADAPENTYVSLWALPNSPVYLKPIDFIRIASDADSRGSDTYYGVALRKAPGDEKNDVYGTRALWVDVDVLTLPKSTFVPSIIVHSGGGFHLYWLLKEYCTNVAKIEEANKLLAKLVEGDSCHNVNRFLRVPGTLNAKRGAICKLGQVHDYVYDIEDFETLAKLEGKAHHKIYTGDSRGYRSRSERDWAVIALLINAGASDELIRTIFISQPCGDKFRDPETNGPEYLAHTIEKARMAALSGSLVAKKSTGPTIVEMPDGYYIDGARGRKRISTFVLDPTIMLARDMSEDTSEDAIVCDVIHPNHTWKDVIFPRGAFNDRKALDKRLSLVAWTWLGRDDDVRLLLPHLLTKLEAKGLPKTAATQVLGRHRDYFVANTQCVSKDEVWTGTTGPIVFFGAARERPEILYSDVPALPGDLVNSLIQINNPAIIWPIIGWFMATPYKPLLENYELRFPVLNVYGTKGSGKTATLRVMQTLMGYKIPHMYDCATTKFVKLTLLGSTNAVPISFSEYRAHLVEQVLHYVLLAYDTGHDPRGKSDQTTVDYPLTAPFSIDGEDVISDPAAKERIIGVRMTPATVYEGTPAYKAFKSLDLTCAPRFAMGYIQHTLGLDVGRLVTFAREAVVDAFPQSLPERVRNNMIVVAVGIASFCEYTGTVLPDVQMVLGGVLSSVWSSDTGRGSVASDEFCEAVCNSVSRHKADFYYYVEDNIVWFQLATAFAWWLRARSLTRQPTLDRDAIRNQLHERNIELGVKGQYILGPKNVNNIWCYGISLRHARAANLDVPDELTMNRVIYDL